MEIKYFHEIQIGASFVIDGEAFIKRSELVFTDSVGMERYIDPLFDAKIGKMFATAAAAAVKTTGVDTSTNSYTEQAAEEQAVRDFLSDADVDRIARRVAELLKGQ